MPPDINLTAAVRQALAFSTLLAQWLILHDWKYTCPPSYNRWAREVLYTLKLEKLRFLLNDSTERFYNTCAPLLGISQFSWLISTCRAGLAPGPWYVRLFYPTYLFWFCPLSLSQEEETGVVSQGLTSFKNTNQYLWLMGIPKSHIRNSFCRFSSLLVVTQTAL